MGRLNVRRPGSAMNPLRATIVLPTLQAEQELEELLPVLRDQRELDGSPLELQISAVDSSSTDGTRARDMFYVVEQDGLKVTNPARITLIKQELVTRANSPGAALLQGGLLFRNSDL